MVTNETGRKIARAMKPGKALIKLQEAERRVPDLVGRTLYDNEFSAVVCLIADVGIKRAGVRNLLRMIKDAHTQRDWWLAGKYFRELAELETSPSKQRRRRAEAKLFSTPSLVVVNPVAKVGQTSPL